MLLDLVQLCKRTASRSFLSLQNHLFIPLTNGWGRVTSVPRLHSSSGHAIRSRWAWMNFPFSLLRFSHRIAIVVHSQNFCWISIAESTTRVCICGVDLLGHVFKPVRRNVHSNEITNWNKYVAPLAHLSMSRHVPYITRTHLLKLLV